MMVDGCAPKRLKSSFGIADMRLSNRGDPKDGPKLVRFLEASTCSLQSDI